MTQYYSLKAYQTTGFPKFMDSYKTLTQARKTANELIKDGYHAVEILYDKPSPSGYFGVTRDLIAIVRA